jgi:small conductance mechanosensitive channel
MNCKKLLDLAVTAGVVVMLSWSVVLFSHAAGDPATADKAAVHVAETTVTAVDMTNVDTYTHYLQLAKDWAFANGPGVLVALAILVFGRWLAMWFSGIARNGFKKAGVDQTLRRFFGKLIYYVLLIGVVFAAAGQLGIDTTSFLAIFGAAGLAVGLALKDSLSNFASGVMLILFRPFKVGDFVTAGGVTGTVQQIDIFSTIISTPDNQRIIVPNAGITSGIITNVNAEETRRVDLVVGIGYEDDIRLAKTTLEEIVQDDSRVLADPAPTIAVSELADSSVNLIVRPWVKTADYWDVHNDLTEKIKLTFDEKDISFPFPQQDVHMYQQATE